MLLVNKYYKLRTYHVLTIILSHRLMMFLMKYLTGNEEEAAESKHTSADTFTFPLSIKLFSCTFTVRLLTNTQTRQMSCLAWGGNCDHNTRTY